MINIAINGFGRIGRSVARAVLTREDTKDLRIVAINDVCDWEILSYLLEHDSTHGILPNAPTFLNNALHFSHNALPPIATLNYKDSQNLDFAALGADIVLESSGVFLDSQSLTHHCQKGVKKVILCASPQDSMPIFAKGVNEANYKGERIFSNASCTANALAPLCKVIEREFGIE